MRNIKEYIESGILELYELGMLNPKEMQEVEEMVSIYPDVKNELDKINISLQQYANIHATRPHVAIKPFLMAMVDYSERIQKGEPVTFPPLLHKGSKKEDYSDWLNKSDMNLPAHFQKVYVKIIGYTPQMLTAIFWLEHIAPPEVHNDISERFLILEGSCNIIIDEKVYSLMAGDYFAIPPHKSHRVEVTSSIPCKAILQRIVV